MMFTLFYMYATVLQWWRLGILKNKLSGTLNSQNALLIYDGTFVYDTKKFRSFETLLFRYDDRIGCTVVPKQKINLPQWVTFPKDYRYFPILFQNNTPKIAYPSMYILIETMLETYLKHSADLLQVENFGELVAWRAADNFEAILKTDLDKLTKLVHCFSQGDIDINHELRLLKIETVDVEGVPTKIKYDRKYSSESVLKYSHAPVHWKKFAENVREMYSRIRDNTPKITIENGKSEDIRKVPVSEVKPIKKDSKKSEDKNTLEVTLSDFRRHKSTDHKRDKHARSDGTSRNDNKTKEEHKFKTGRSEKDLKNNEEHRKDVRDESKEIEEEKSAVQLQPLETDTKQAKDVVDKATTKENPGIVEVNKEKDATKKCKTKSERQGKNETKLRGKTGEKPSKREASKSRKEDDDKGYKKGDKSSKSAKLSEDKSKGDLENPSRKENKSKGMSKRATSSEKKLVKGQAVCDETDDKQVKDDTCGKQTKSCGINHGSSNGNASVRKKAADINCAKNVKPPNILIYADSLVAKENVKAALLSMLNKDKYTIYDLPTDPNQTMWNDSTVLVVVCGTVPPNLTSHLLQYLLRGGQLLCLCSDLLYSVLHTFTTAEVREHELVRFTYGKWKQVRMMHHIFCYQASPAKKQFSKDSDHSNHSSDNGSSPVAYRTPSAVEIQNNGKDYIIHVQVLGTEETWQTPSLLLATVKEGEGRAIFSQVHLEIDPNEYEDDENKFEALKDSDQARLEILSDILANHLDIDCTSTSDIAYTPAYFLGRHDMKLKLLNECESIKENKMECEKVSLRFCGKDEVPEPANSTFLPVFIHSCPSNFSTVNYFEALETEYIGRLAIYADVMASSQLLLSQSLSHGLVVIPRQQTKGVGSANNIWISPVGSALFSLQLHIPLDSPLGKVIPFVQQLVMVGIVSAIRTRQGCEGLDIGIKWPNDLYANGKVKIGGLLATSCTTGSTAIVNVGCGINLDNPNPTVCINDLIRISNLDKGTSMMTIPYETFFAALFNEIEKIYKIAQGGDLDYAYDLYYKYWLHNDSDITVTTKDGKLEKVKIVGIDNFGFLKVRSANGTVITVQPDGNTFDMLKGLISPKVF